MLFGRPTNLWVGLITAAGGTLQVLLIALVPTINAATVATVIGAVVLFLGVLVAFLANQPPTVNPGDQIKVTTPPGQATATVTVPTVPAL